MGQILLELAVKFLEKEMNKSFAILDLSEGNFTLQNASPVSGSWMECSKSYRANPV